MARVTENSARAYAGFLERGMPPHIAAGMVGNLMQESGLDIDTTAVGDNGNSFGAVQWNGPRKRAFLEYANKTGKSAVDLDTQIDYIMEELGSSESKAFQTIMGSKTVEEAAVNASRAFWRPGDPREENRVRYASLVHEIPIENGTQETEVAESKTVSLESVLGPNPLPPVGAQTGADNAPPDGGQGGPSQSLEGALGPAPSWLQQIPSSVPQGPMAAEAEPGFFQRAGEAISGAASSVANTVVDTIVGKGWDVEELTVADLSRMPEVSSPWELAHRLDLARDEDAMANIISRVAPDLEIQSDSDGNLYVESESGGVYALDKDGLSWRDLTDLGHFLWNVGGATVGGILGKAAAKKAGLGEGVGEVIGSGVGAGAAETMELYASNAVGGGQSEDYFTQFVMSTAFGLGGDVAARAITAVGAAPLRIITKAKAQNANRQHIESELRRNGYKPEDVTEAFREWAEREGGIILFGNEDVFDRILAAQMLPEPIELTTGQATRNPGLFRAEGIARETGDPIAVQSSERQQSALLRNAEELVGDGARGTNVADRGGTVLDSVERRRAADKTVVDNAYDYARNAAPVNYDLGEMDDIIGAIQRDLSRRFSPESYPRVHSVFDDWRNNLGEVDEAGNLIGESVEIQQLMDWRLRVSNLRSDTTKQAEQNAYKRIIDQFDAAIDSALPMEGNSAAHNLWRRARNLNQEYEETWHNKGDVLERLTRRDGANQLAVGYEDVFDEILGKSFAGRKGVLADIKKIKNQVEPIEWEMIRAEGMIRLLGFDPSQAVPGKPISTKIDENLRSAFKNHPEVMKAMFNDNEIRAIRRFADTVTNINKRVEIAGQTNPSGSGLVMAQTGRGTDPLEVSVKNEVDGITGAAIRAGKVFSPKYGIMAEVFLKSIYGPAATYQQQLAVRRSIEGLVPNASALPRPALSQLPSVAGNIGAAVGADSFDREDQTPPN